MNRVFLRVQFITAIFAVAPLPAAAEQTRPNIVVILADDLGYGDLACYGGTDIPTPHIDSIARDGVRFTNAYAYPSCSPTRASLMTGQYAERFGISGALMGEDAPKIAKATTIAQRLKDAGYATGIVGKWHLGYSDDVSPTHKGFDEFFGFRGGKIDFFKHTDTAQKDGSPDGKHDLWEGEKPIKRDGYTTHLFTDRARQFIRDHGGKDKPFFLHLTYNAPHYGKSRLYQAPDEYLKRFNALGQTDGRNVYRAMVSCLDDGVGEVLAELKAQKIEGETLVWFMSDNGAEPIGSNKPLKGFKQSYQEGGVRVPWIARLPGRIRPGVVRDDVVHAIDFAPTLLALAGAEPVKPDTFDGVNVWPAFTGNAPQLSERTIHFSDRGMRMGKWKMLNGKLYDLQADPAESTDVSPQHVEIVNQMIVQTTEWAKSMGIKPKPPAKK
jgi:arylsulfatase A